MMGRLNHDQEQFFYSFRLDEAVPNDHPVREVASVLDLSWVHSELAPYYPRIGRPSIDPIRMLIIGYVFAIRSERKLMNLYMVVTTASKAAVCPLAHKFECRFERVATHRSGGHKAGVTVNAQTRPAVGLRPQPQSLAPPVTEEL
jgi:hypothetical protein